jgi:hypothetical protein
MQIAPVPSIPVVLDRSNVVGVFCAFEEYIKYFASFLENSILLNPTLLEKDKLNYYSICQGKLFDFVGLFYSMKDKYDEGSLPFSAAVLDGESVIGSLGSLSDKLGKLREELISYGFGVDSSAVYSASAVTSSMGGSVGGGASANPVAPAEFVATKKMRIDNLRTQLSDLSVELNTLKSSGGSRVTKAAFVAIKKHIKEAEVCIAKAAANQNPNDQYIWKLVVFPGKKRGWETLLGEAETAIGSAQRMVGALAVPAAATAGGGASAPSDGAMQIAYAFTDPVDNVGNLPVAVALGASVAINSQSIFGGALVASKVASASHQAPRPR